MVKSRERKPELKKKPDQPSAAAMRAQFKYSGLKFAQKTISAGEKLSVSVAVKNTGRLKAGEVVWFYICAPVKGRGPALKQLAGFEKIEIMPHKTKRARFLLEPEQMKVSDAKGIKKNVFGKFRLWIGGSVPGAKRTVKGRTRIVASWFEVVESKTGGWSVYIVRCSDNTLYTGISNDVDRRIKAHNSGKGAQYTKVHGPVKLEYFESGYTPGDALRREREIKHLARAEKEKLIEKGTA